eukprot:TRINITY_DN63655_c0_g1_i1.p1 TRINITY_DN63655_c0_g1~~TRINITY_DN63655_c0_g1_i1.p1  ORF type:complete len:674 (-),score=127.08 TRINITY_DN63655_c0_g1_i1:182-2101(-)
MEEASASKSTRFLPSLQAQALRSPSRSSSNSGSGRTTLSGCCSPTNREQTKASSSASGAANDLAQAAETAPDGFGRGAIGQAPKKRAPPQGRQSSEMIKSVFDIHKAVRVLVHFTSSRWNAENGTQSCFRQVLPGLARVHVGDTDEYVVPGFLLQDLEPVITRSEPTGKKENIMITDPAVQDVYVKFHTPYFKHIIVLLKIRWLLRLHSACCELDYKMCSIATVVKGIQYVALQQWAEAESDSIFDIKVNKQIGSHVNLESLLNDIIHQLQKGMGGSWRGFLEYVGTCDPNRSVHYSRMDLSPAQIISNDNIRMMIDTIFVACFLRGRREDVAADLKGLYATIEMLGLQVPVLPPLRAGQNLRIWGKAKMKQLTQHDRHRANRKDIEKLAQLDAVLLCAAIELQSPEVFATPEEAAEMSIATTMPKKLLQVGDVAPPPVDVGVVVNNTIEAPPPARQILVDKPLLSPPLFNAVLHCIHHHMTFPSGIRERMYSLLVEDYGLSREQSERLAIAVTQNIDGKRLPNHTLLEMEAREKVRLHDYEATSFKDCSHLLLSPLVSAPLERTNRPRYTAAVPTRHNYDSLAMTKSLPDLRGFSVRRNDGRDAFKVPLSTGPLTHDASTNMLRTTGFFIKMPPLSYT